MSGGIWRLPRGPDGEVYVVCEREVWCEMGERLLCCRCRG